MAAEKRTVNMTTPFTFRESLAAGRGPVHVQVQISKVTTCAKVREGWIGNDGTFLWALELLMPYKGRASFPENRVRRCSGVDGFCLCADEQKEGTRASGELLFGSSKPANFEAGDAPGFCHARVVAPRDSLNIENSAVFDGVVR